MPHFVGYAIDDYGKGVPISTGATKDEALSLAITRTLSLGISSGEIGVKEPDVSEEEFVSLTALLNDWFAAKGIN